MKMKLYWYVALPLSFWGYLMTRNFTLRNTMDRTYYSVEHVYRRMRSQQEREHDKNKE